MSLADIEADNARLKAELEKLDADSALVSLRAENDLLRQLAFAKVKRQPAPQRQKFARSYFNLVEAGRREGLHLPTLPQELLCITGLAEAPPTPVELPLEEAAADVPEPAQAAAVVAAPKLEFPLAAPAEEEAAPEAPRAVVAVAEPLGAPELPATAAKVEEAEWERVAAAGDTEAYVKKGEDDSLTFSFGGLFKSLVKKITGA